MDIHIILLIVSFATSDATAPLQPAVIISKQADMSIRTEQVLLRLPSCSNMNDSEVQNANLKSVNNLLRKMNANLLAPIQLNNLNIHLTSLSLQMMKMIEEQNNKTNQLVERINLFQARNDQLVERINILEARNNLNPLPATLCINLYTIIIDYYQSDIAAFKNFEALI